MHRVRGPADIAAPAPPPSPVSRVEGTAPAVSWAELGRAPAVVSRYGAGPHESWYLSEIAARSIPADDPPDPLPRPLQFAGLDKEDLPPRPLQVAGLGKEADEGFHCDNFLDEEFICDVPVETVKRIPRSRHRAASTDHTGGSGTAKVQEHSSARNESKKIGETWRIFQKTVGGAHAVALSEAHGRIRQTFEEASLFPEVEDGDNQDVGQGGSCGFTVAMRGLPLPSQRGANLVSPLVPLRGKEEADRRRGRAGGGNIGPRHHFGMCHHFTWDGQHCVTAGLSAEHANRCAGALVEAGNAAEGELCRSGLQACSSGSFDGEMPLQEAVCVPPRWSTHVVACRADTCPFMAEGRECPYNAAESPRAGLIFHL